MGCGAQRCRQCLWFLGVPSQHRCCCWRCLLLCSVTLVLFHSYMSPSTVCGDREPFQEPPSFSGFLLGGQEGAAWVGLVGMATLSFLGFFFLEKALVGRFLVCSPLAALPVASLVAIVGPAHGFFCAGFAHCFQFAVLLLDAAMLELRVRVGAFLVVHELLIFLLAGRTQSKEGSKTLVFKGERYVKFFSQAFCFESVFLRASVAFWSSSAALQLHRQVPLSSFAVCRCGRSDCHILPIGVCLLQVLCYQGSRSCSCAGQWLLEGGLHESSSCILQSACGQVPIGVCSCLLSCALAPAGILEGWHVLGLRIQRAARIVEVTVRARQSRPSLRCGHVLGLRMLLIEAS